MDNLPEKLQSKLKINEVTGCWEWQASKSSAGYGTATYLKKSTSAHRIIYELLVKEIPKGLQIDHLCRVRSCCNPSHLEIVTHKENLRRGDTVAAKHAAKTHCPQGHEYTEENTYRAPNENSRKCRTCIRGRSYVRQ